MRSWLCAPHHDCAVTTPRKFRLLIGLPVSVGSALTVWRQSAILPQVFPRSERHAGLLWMQCLDMNNVMYQTLGWTALDVVSSSWRVQMQVKNMGRACDRSEAGAVRCYMPGCGHMCRLKSGPLPVTLNLILTLSGIDAIAETTHCVGGIDNAPCVPPQHPFPPLSDAESTTMYARSKRAIPLYMHAFEGMTLTC
eukprot:350888-Chlamydomonas_euryale.AAC.9